MREPTPLRRLLAQSVKSVRRGNGLGKIESASSSAWRGVETSSGNEGMAAREVKPANPINRTVETRTRGDSILIADKSV